ncbi:unnamed protein product [Ilex paraguariensis]|uniref:GBF-interacting protein 1 N-terminal domain-containing protein n=1 Tax=Ilex paraguariensis TaxID=185542 RepID=A0ABC8RNH4_9AQUA
MSGRGSNNGGSGGVQAIPAASRKMVQSLKEIVTCPEQEIYAMLKDCNMDPNEAVNRLLSQDPFHEVKSKRDKKKENKDTTEFRSRGVSSASNRGSRSGTDRYIGRGGSTQFSSSGMCMLNYNFGQDILCVIGTCWLILLNMFLLVTFLSEPGAIHGKPAYKKENGTNFFTSSPSSASGMAGNNPNRRPQAPMLVSLESQLAHLFCIYKYGGCNAAS